MIVLEYVVEILLYGVAADGESAEHYRKLNTQIFRCEFRECIRGVLGEFRYVCFFASYGQIVLLVKREQAAYKCAARNLLDVLLGQGLVYSAEFVVCEYKSVVVEHVSRLVERERYRSGGLFRNYGEERQRCTHVKIPGGYPAYYERIAYVQVVLTLVAQVLGGLPQNAHEFLETPVFLAVIVTRVAHCKCLSISEDYVEGICLCAEQVDRVFVCRLWHV